MTFFMKVLRDPSSQDIIVALKTAEAVRALVKVKKQQVITEILARQGKTLEDVLEGRN